MEAELVETENKELAIVQAKLPAFLEQVKALSVEDQESYDFGIQMSIQAEVYIRKIRESTKGNIDRWHKGHQDAIKERNDRLAPWEAIKTEINPKCMKWLREEESKRELEAIRAKAEGKKKDEDDRLAQAEALTEAGETEAAESILNAPSQTVEYQAPPPIEKGDGVGMRQGIWKFKVTNLKAVAKGVVEGRYPESYIQIGETTIGGIARATKGQAKIDGIEFYQEQDKIQHRMK